MTILVVIESELGKIKKSGLELASYGRKIADDKGLKLTAVGFNIEDYSVLNKYGVDKLYNVETGEDIFFDVDRYSETITKIIKEENAILVVVSSSADGRYLGPVLSIKTQSAYIPNVVEVPSQYEPIQVKCSCFTNKAFKTSKSLKNRTIISLLSNSFGLNEKASSLELINHNYENGTVNLKVDSVDKVSDKVSIADAQIVVSGGRGLKGPENWYLIEDLAEVLGAATACSKPVSDMGWRPHSEHVGQTGKPVASNLYIAVGVSGAIQHLAGINSSKIKVVINNDPEAPFFKAADYGIVGDAFDVIPKLTEKLKMRK
ncbi:MAG: electron transfer flavoprotein subunit alpha/FixB family protein [Flavobacteriaceae bacterium]